MDPTQPLVLVVDDDESVRRSLRWLLTSAGYAVATFSSGSDMLEHRPDQPAILLMDVRMPDMTGLEVKQKLVGTGRDMVTVFITGHDDVAIGVEAMKSGAEDFLLKPFEETEVLDAVQRAISRHRSNQEERLQVADIGGRYETLTPREHEVCERVIAGRLNKQIAAELGMCEQTVKVHRSRVMRKMHAYSLADLVRAVDLFHRLSGPAIRTDTPVAVPTVVDGSRVPAPAYTPFSHYDARLVARSH